MADVKVCILLGEGESERTFFPSFLKNKFGFASTSEKNAFIFKKNEIFWIFTQPPGKYKGKTGKERFHQIDIYRDSETILQSNSYLFNGKKYDVFFRILVDTDGNSEEKLQQQREKLEKIFKASCVQGDFRIVFVKNELESWYLAGLPENFPYFLEGSPFCEILQGNPEEFTDPKGELKKIIKPDFMPTIKLADTMGAYFDVDKGKKKSATFQDFILDLEKKGLI